MKPVFLLFLLAGCPTTPTKPDTGEPPVEVDADADGSPFPTTATTPTRQ